MREKILKLLVVLFVFAIGLISGDLVWKKYLYIPMNEQHKLAKIKQCTDDGFGLKITYSDSEVVTNVSCCTKNEINCDLSNLKR